MANQANDSFRDFGRKVEETINEHAPRVEEEVQKVIAYLNDEVIPGLRENSAKALKTASEQFAKLADYLDHRTGEK